jgi:hypothetical protein
MPVGPRCIGLPRGLVGGVSAHDEGPCRPTVHRLFRIGFILRCRLSSSEFLRPRARPFGHCCPGFLPSSRHHRRRLHTWDFQAPLRSVLGFSQPLDGLLRHRLCGLVSSRSHVQGSPFRVFSRSAAPPSRRRRLPPCPWSCRCSPVTRLPRLPVWTSRLCSAERCVRSDSGFSLARCRSPLRLASSSRYPAADPGPVRARLSVSAHDVSRRYLRRRVATEALVSPLRLQRCSGSPASSRVSATTDLLEVLA